MAVLLAGQAGAQPAGSPRRVDLTGGRLAMFIDENGTKRDKALVLFVGEEEIVAPLPDPTVVSSTLRIFSDKADTADDGTVFLDRSSWRRRGDGFVYRGYSARDRAPGGIVYVLFKPGRRGGILMIWANGDGYGANAISGPVSYVQVAFGVGPVTYVGRFQAPPARERSNTAEKVVLSGRNASVPPPPGHELLDLRGFPDIVVWGTQDLTTERFDAIELPPGWIRNQPRAGVGAVGRFLRSPGRDADGEFTRQEMFGASWLHQATVVGFGGSPDDEGLFSVAFVDKHHELSWRAGSSITLLTSPDGEEYALISRDDRRTSDTPTIPGGWLVEDVFLEEDLHIQLPRPTTNIRADNQDSFQGPLPPGLDF